MSTITKRYCAKGVHPRWRDWTAKYDDNAPTIFDGNCATRASWLGEFCIHCGAQVFNTASDGSPDSREYGRIYVMRGLNSISQKEFEHNKKRSVARIARIVQLRKIITR